MIHTESPARVELEVIPRNKGYRIAAKQLKRRITEKLKPSILLPMEPELTPVLDVSRSAARDTLRSFGALGRLEQRQGIGTVVCDSSVTPPDSLVNMLLETREMSTELLNAHDN